MNLTRYDEPFILSSETFQEIYDEGMEYFYQEVLGLYTDTIINDPMEGIQLAFSDFLSNDSPLQNENGEYLSWDEALALGKEIYDLSHLDEYTKRFGSGILKPLPKTKKNLKQNGVHEISDWLQALIDDGSPENGKYLVFDRDDTLFRKLLEKVDTTDLDRETLEELADDDLWDRWYSIRNGIIAGLADEVLKEPTDMQTTALIILNYGRSGYEAFAEDHDLFEDTDDSLHDGVSSFENGSHAFPELVFRLDNVDINDKPEELWERLRDTAFAGMHPNSHRIIICRADNIPAWAYEFSESAHPDCIEKALKREPTLLRNPEAIDGWIAANLTESEAR